MKVFSIGVMVRGGGWGGGIRMGAEEACVMKAGVDGGCKRFWSGT